jgi:hypothetical protein
MGSSAHCSPAASAHWAWACPCRLQAWLLQAQQEGSPGPLACPYCGADSSSSSMFVRVTRSIVYNVVVMLVACLLYGGKLRSSGLSLLWGGQQQHGCEVD